MLHARQLVPGGWGRANRTESGGTTTAAVLS